MFYSKSTNGFYTKEIHGDNIPSDAVEITVEEHQNLIAGQSSGKIISSDNDGKPVLVDPPLPTKEELYQSNLDSRLSAYKTESDPLKLEAEYDALINNTEPDYSAWITKVQEIKARYPLSEGE